MSDMWQFIANILVQLFVLAVVIGVALIASADRNSLLQRVVAAGWRCLTQLAVHPRRAMLVVGLFVFLITAAAQWIAPRPPVMHDEFSNLLLADTFASGRLSNPTHPLAKHFETFHVLQQPSYSSKYPPALALALALGQMLLGAAPIGICLLHAAAAVAVTWMLQAWTRNRWAFVGGLLFGLLPFVHTEWARNFMGGGATVMSAALVLGGCKYISIRCRWSDGALLGLGLICLANSRPFEGFVFAVVCLTWLVAQLIRQPDAAWGRVAIRAAAPAALVLLMGASLMAAHCRAVTGNWLRLPYLEHQDQYAISPSFVWQSINSTHLAAEESLPNRVFRRFYETCERGPYVQQQSLYFLSIFKSVSLLSSIVQLLNPVLLAAVLVLTPWLVSRRLALPWILLIVSSVAAISVVWLQAHYIAPMLPPMLVLLTEGLRRVFVWRRQFRQGRTVVLSLVSLQAGLLLLTIALLPVSQTVEEWAAHRATIQKALEKSGKRHLVVVAYTPQHNPHWEWVYNRADIDRSPVVWARYLDKQSNRQLFEYYRDREQWILMADTSPPQLIRVTEESVGDLTAVKQTAPPVGIAPERRERIADPDA